MVLPFFIFADNPIVPADRDSSQSAPSTSQAQVETRSVEVTGYETSSSYSSDEEGVEEVIVTGIRRSLQNAIDIKRNNVGIVDAITAEDFGKFPDGNLAESLARVAGIGIDRSNVEGARIAVRGFGPELNLVTLNGRQMPTVPGQYEGGRSFNFGDISSHGIAAVEVYKSVNSALPSGGIGAAVNMVTTKPLNIEGTLTSGSINYLHDSTSKEDKPIEAAFVHSANKGQWGYCNLRLYSGKKQCRRRYQRIKLDNCRGSWLLQRAILEWIKMPLALAMEINALMAKHFTKNQAHT